MTIPQDPASHEPTPDGAATWREPAAQQQQPFGLASQLGTSGPRRMPKPATVRWGLGILWVGVALTIVLTFLALLLLVGAGADAAASGNGGVVGIAMVFLVVAIAIVVVQAVLLVFAGRGRTWARIALAVVSGLSLLLGIVSGDGVNFGSALTVVAVVLLFVPASNAWYEQEQRLPRR